MISLKVMVGETRDSLRELPGVTSHSYGTDGRLEVEGFVKKSLIYGEDKGRGRGFMLAGVRVSQALFDAGISQAEIDAAIAHIKGLGFQDVEIHSPPDALVTYIAKGYFQNCEIVGDALAFFRDGSLGSIGGNPPLNIGTVTDLPQSGETQFLECEGD